MHERGDSTTIKYKSRAKLPSYPFFTSSQLFLPSLVAQTKFN